MAAEQLAQQRAAEIQTKKNAINSLNNKIGELETQLRAAKERNSVLAAALEQKAGTAVESLDGRSSKRTREADIVRALMQSRLLTEDIADVCALVLRFAGPDRTSILEDLEDSPSFQPYLKKLRYMRDLEVAEHLTTKVFTEKKWELLRLACTWSWRDCNIGRITFRNNHDQRNKKTGNRVKGRARQMLMDDSDVPVPDLFPTELMRGLEQRVLAGAPVNEQHEDHRGAEVSDVSWWIEHAIVAAKTSKQGGLTTEGRSPADRIWVIVTFDGAGLTDDDSCVRLAFSIASVRRLNQSPNCVYNLVAFRAKEHGEHILSIKVRFGRVRLQLAQIYANQGQLSPGGEPNGRYIWIGFTGDKPALCHGLARAGFQSDAALPHCMCPGADIFKLNHDHLSHYGNITMEQRAAWSHTPMHEVLGQPEPAGEWFIDCSCCKRVSCSVLWLRARVTCILPICGIVHIMFALYFCCHFIF